jgi:HEAT repeat protein
VGRIGSSRDEGERGRLIDICSGLGREMSLALADALGEARDRFQRRAFMDAILAQGEQAREMAEGMVEDPRWYVVRNGVALLGELGGEGVVSNLTMTLANEDPRVRKETVVALAKVGGDDASMLLLGMMDDSDHEVRAKACWAVGVLRVERALKPLLRLLEKDPNEEVQAQSLQALGQIGDPGAVPAIEKKAVVRMFSRPSKGVRMAAYRALASIGTPHARSLLLKATKDPDMDVRKLALTLLI